jgi:hypothetical protein
VSAPADRATAPEVWAAWASAIRVTAAWGAVGWASATRVAGAGVSAVRAAGARVSEQLAGPDPALAEFGRPALTRSVSAWLPGDWTEKAALGAGLLVSALALVSQAVLPPLDQLLPAAEAALLR